MTVRLDVGISDGQDAALGFDSSEDLSARVSEQPNLETEIRKGVSLSASVGSQPNLGIASDSVMVPVANDYEALYNKPRIEDVELVGNKTFIDLGLVELTNEQILEIWNTVQRSS